MFKDDLAYWINGKEIALFESTDLIEIRLTREVVRRRRQEFKGDPRVDLRYSGSDWITVRFSTPHDRALVMELVEGAAAAHRRRGSRLSYLPPALTWNAATISTNGRSSLTGAQDVPVCAVPPRACYHAVRVSGGGLDGCGCAPVQFF